MKESFKIALGVFLGLLAAGLCAVCIFFTISFSGLAYLFSSIDVPGSTPVSPDFSLYPTLSATSTPVPGYIKQCHDLGLSIESYRVSETCPDSLGQPAEGAKFVVVEIKAVNFSDDVISFPYIEFRLDGYQSGLGSTGDCRYNNEAFGNACSGKLFPGVSCQGWELFEVPVSFDASAATLYASFRENMNDVKCDAQWPLESP